METPRPLPAAVNVRSPEAIRRIVRSVQAGEFRNYSEAAEILIIEASERRRFESCDGHPTPATLAGDTRPGPITDHRAAS
jgi:hypothetical protein